MLCDGIETDKKPFGHVLNLTGPHAGRLSVSRKELQDFDRAWAEQNWRKGARALSAWSGLTMEWLWQLDRAGQDNQDDQDSAQVLWDEWQGKGISVRRHGLREEHALDEVGWFHLDDALSPDASGRHSPSAERRFFPWRAAALRHSYSKHALTSPMSLVGHPVPGPGDARIFTNVAGTWQAVVAHAAKHRITVAEVLRRQRRLRIVHPSQGPPPVTDGDLDWVPDELDGMLADVLAGQLRGEHTPTVYGSVGGSDLGGLVLASHRLAVPLGVLARRSARLAPLLREPVPLAPAHHEDYVCTDEDMVHLFGKALADSHIRRQGLDRVGSARQVRAVWQATETEPSELLRRISEFGWLGWTAPPLEEVTKWLDLDEDVHEVLTLFTTPLPDGRLLLRWAATIDFADTRDISLEQAEAELTRVAVELGLVYEARYTGDRHAGRLVPSTEAAQLLRDMVAIGRHLETGLDLEGLALVWAYAEDTPSADDDLAATVLELQRAGVPAPDDTSIITAWKSLPLRSRYVLAGKDVLLDEEDYPAAELTTASLFSAGMVLQESLREVWEIARRDGKRFGLAVPHLPEQLAGYRPTSHDSALTTQPRDPGGHFTGHVWRQLTPRALCKYAHDLSIDAATAHERLARLRPLGALVPDLTPQALHTLRSSVPDERDLIALSEEHLLTESDEAPGALGLVSVAGRLGEPLPLTLGRLTPYLSMWSDSRQLPDPPDTIPLWQDLALLSRHLDGRLPALEGQVTHRHVACAARATGESEAWVRNRLRLYSSLFDLHLDSLDD